MSDRNTLLLVSEPITEQQVSAAFCTAFGDSIAELEGIEAPRLGRVSRGAQSITVISLRLFEVGGVRSLEDDVVPPADDEEVALAVALSQGGRTVCFVHYDEERGAGGHVVWRNGQLASRRFYDGRGLGVVLRDLEGSHPIAEPEDGDWIWDLIGDAVEEGVRDFAGAGVRTDDDIEALIREADPRPVSLAERPPSVAPQSPTRFGLRRRVKRWLRGN